ncbi:hypothetical protein ACFOOM_24890 [Streptomyces echinoruber]|uniref:Uncharacterized protein n=1 Tax=Streptomyces echinoruber TaxID=68898 RepID=A0A918RGM8_9ACTN|nr:hypothetical protein GCM10010389_41860 [Streptomyces echinoruber]
MIHRSGNRSRQAAELLAARGARAAPTAAFAVVAGAAALRMPRSRTAAKVSGHTLQRAFALVLLAVAVFMPIDAVVT